jgi:hypothetical protein
MLLFANILESFDKVKKLITIQQKCGKSWKMQEDCLVATRLGEKPSVAG